MRRTARGENRTETITLRVEKRVPVSFPLYYAEIPFDLETRLYCIIEFSILFLQVAETNRTITNYRFQVIFYLLVYIEVFS